MIAKSIISQVLRQTLAGFRIPGAEFQISILRISFSAELNFPGFEFKVLIGLLCNVQECSRTCCFMPSHPWFINRVLRNHTEHSRLPGLLIYNGSS